MGGAGSVGIPSAALRMTDFEGVSDNNRQW